jgi:hypothetical protein
MTVPSLGVMKPPSVERSVVLPQPEGPRRTMYSPASISRLMLSRARKVPKSWLIPEMEMEAVSGVSFQR